MLYENSVILVALTRAIEAKEKTSMLLKGIYTRRQNKQWAHLDAVLKEAEEIEKRQEAMTDTLATIFAQQVLNSGHCPHTMDDNASGERVCYPLERK